MARWKARVEFLLSVIKLLFTARRNARIASTVLAMAFQSVCLSVRTSVCHTPVLCQDSLLSGEGRSLGAKISGGRVVPGEYFFGFYKTRHILLSGSANCTVLCAVVLTHGVISDLLVGHC